MATYQRLPPHPNPLPMGEGATLPQMEAEFQAAGLSHMSCTFRDLVSMTRIAVEEELCGGEIFDGRADAHGKAGDCVGHEGVSFICRRASARHMCPLAGPG